MKSNLLVSSLQRSGKSILLFFMIFYSFQGFSQTTATIDYTQTFPPYTCDAFMGSPTISGYQHFTIKGQPVQNSNSGVKALEVDCIQSTQGNTVYLYGGQYNIKYPFKFGFSYSFTFTMECSTNASVTGVPTVYFGLTNSLNISSLCAPTTGVSRQPGDNANFSSSFQTSVTNGSSNMYTVGPQLFQSLDNNYAYLAVSCLLPGNANDGHTPVYIKNIKIVEMPETYGISPTSTNIQCGVQATQVFSAVNTFGGTRGVTGYVWSLGANNGWLYNGSPAPASVVTGVNSISLTSNGGTSAPNPITLSINGITAKVSPAVATVNFCPCFSGTTGLTTINDESTLSWNAQTGAATYNISVQDISGGSTYTTNLTSNSTNIGFCPRAVGDNVSFSVQPVCSSGGTGSFSAPYSYIYAPTALPAPTNVTFTPTSPYTVAWSAVPGATAYYYETNINSPVYVNGTSVSDPDAELSNGQTYQVSVQATNGCVSSPYSTPIQAVMPPLCPAPITGLTALNNQSTISWDAQAGTTSYNISIQDVSGGSTYTTNLTSNTNSIGFCPRAIGDNVSVSVQPVCSSGISGSFSSAYSYTYAPTPLPAPSNVTFTSTPPYTVAWNAVPGATGYYYVTNANSPVPVSGTSISDPDAELSNGQTYQVSVQATNGCINSPFSTPIQAVMPPVCSAPTVSYVQNGTYVILYPVPNALSYNVGFENTSGTIVYEVTNIGSVITSQGFQCTGVPHGSFYIVAQANCSGITSPWGSPYFGGLQTTSTVTQLNGVASALNVGNDPDSSGISIYPNPASSQIKVSYNAVQSGLSDITVMTELGVTVIHKTFGATAGSNSQSLNIGQIANGIYILKIMDGKNIHVKKLIIQK